MRVLMLLLLLVVGLEKELRLLRLKLRLLLMVRGVEMLMRAFLHGAHQARRGAKLVLGAAHVIVGIVKVYVQVSRRLFHAGLVGRRRVSCWDHYRCPVNWCARVQVHRIMRWWLLLRGLHLLTQEGAFGRRDGRCGVGRLVVGRVAAVLVSLLIRELNRLGRKAGGRSRLGAAVAVAARNGGLIGRRRGQRWLSCYIAASLLVIMLLQLVLV